MKKIILVAAVVLVAVIGLTSYNGKETKKDKADGNLIAQVTNGGGALGSAKKTD